MPEYTEIADLRGEIAELRAAARELRDELSVLSARVQTMAVKFDRMRESVSFLMAHAEV